MIGLEALGTYAIVSVCIGILTLVIGSLLVGIARSAKDQYVAVKLGAFGFALFIWFMVASSWVSHVWLDVTFKQWLCSLNQDEIAGVTIDGLGLAGTQKTQTLCDALKKNDWFLPNHGGWAQPVDMSISLKNGTVRHLQVAFFTKHKSGAIVTDKDSPLESKVFCPDLPAAMLSIGRSLPAK